MAPSLAPLYVATSVIVVKNAGAGQSVEAVHPAFVLDAVSAGSSLISWPSVIKSRRHSPCRPSADREANASADSNESQRDA